MYGPNNEAIYGARSIAGSLLPAIVAAIASIAVLKRSRWPLVLMFLALGLSLSRSALAIALIMLMTFAFRGKKGAALLKSVLFSGGLLVGVILLYTYYEPFRNRFEQGDGYEVGGFTLGSSGRTNLWGATYEHWLQSPWVGFGAGSSEVLTMQRFNITHPHSDYLRLLHDYGILGLALFVVAVVGMGYAAWKRYRASRGVDQAIHLAALLGVLQLLLFMVANNPIVNVFFMLALAVVLGVSIGRGTPAHQDKLIL